MAHLAPKLPTQSKYTLVHFAQFKRQDRCIVGRVRKIGSQFPYGCFQKGEPVHLANAA